LYCGKELALLKRLRGGGEFCSDAHRQQYQEEYNQLALNRLLQAKEAPKEAPPLAGGKAAPAEPAPAAGSKSGAAIQAREREPEPVRERAASPAAKLAGDAGTGAPVAPEAPKPAPPPEVKPPAPPAGFFVELFLPSEPPPVTVRVELEHLASLTPAIPGREAIPLPESLAGGPGLAGRVPVAAAQALDIPLSPRARGVESREFGGPVRAFENLRMFDGSTIAAGLVPERTRQPHPVETQFIGPAPGALWTAPEQLFDHTEIALGELARLEFGTVGWGKDSEDPIRPRSAVTEAHSVEVEESPATVEAQVVPPEPSPEPKAPPLQLRPARLAPVVVHPPSKRPIPFSAEPIWSKPQPATVARVAAPIPDPQSAASDLPPVSSQAASDPLPVEIPAVPAPRANPTQVFSSPLIAGGEVQVPRSGALPLRPLMVLGPAPASAKTAEVAGEPKKPGAAEPQSAAAQDGRERKGPGKPPEQQAAPQRPAGAVKPSEPAKAAAPVNEKIKGALRRGQESGGAPGRGPQTKPPAVTVKPVTARKPPRPEPVPPEAEPAVVPQAEAPFPIPAPAASVAPPTREEIPAPPREAVPEPAPEIDLGLPTLRLETREGFWSRLPVVAKIGIAAAILAAVSGLAYMVMNGGRAGATPPVASRTTIQPGAPILDSTWVADWSADAAKRGRRISILKTALPLTDYRMQFEAQIESKAIGWVYRAKDQQNYYVAKLEVIKPGLEPVVALVRFAVVNGQDEARSTTPLRQRVRVDTVYKVRFDAVGSKFTAWVGDEKVLEWTDQRFHAGSPGLMNEKGESAVMHGPVNVMPLVVKKQ
jgi:hypothetical protein